MSEIVYSCEICKKQVKVPKGQPIPLCCKKEMTPLPFCTTAPNAEMARNYEAEEPCDDGTGPRKD